MKLRSEAKPTFSIEGKIEYTLHNRDEVEALKKEIADIGSGFPQLKKFLGALGATLADMLDGDGWDGDTAVHLGPDPKAYGFYQT